MQPPFQASRSFCDQFGRYTVLPEIETLDQVKSGAEFRLVDLVQTVLDKYLSAEQQQARIKSRGAATFDNPVILRRWQVKRVGPTEKATHNVLKARGEWRENIPGVEWLNTTVAEVESIVAFVTSG